MTREQKLEQELVFHKQEFRHDPENGVHGDCGRAVIASLLGLPLSAVPHEHREMTGAEFNAAADAFLKSRGVTRIWIAFQAESVDQATDWASQWSNGMHFVLMGASPRGTNHVVIGHKGKIVHDPHPDGGNLAGPTDNGLYYVEWLVASPRTAEKRLAEAEAKFGDAISVLEDIGNRHSGMHIPKGKGDPFSASSMRHAARAFLADAAWRKKNQ